MGLWQESGAMQCHKFLREAAEAPEIRQTRHFDKILSRDLYQGAQFAIAKSGWPPSAAELRRYTQPARLSISRPCSEAGGDGSSLQFTCASREGGQPAPATPLFERRLIFNTNEERSWRSNALFATEWHAEVKVGGVDAKSF